MHHTVVEFGHVSVFGDSGPEIVLAGNAEHVACVRQAVCLHMWCSRTAFFPRVLCSQGGPHSHTRSFQTLALDCSLGVLRQRFVHPRFSVPWTRLWELVLRENPFASQACSWTRLQSQDRCPFPQLRLTDGRAPTSTITCENPKHLLHAEPLPNSKFQATKQTSSAKEAWWSCPVRCLPLSSSDTTLEQWGLCEGPCFVLIHCKKHP